MAKKQAGKKKNKGRGDSVASAWREISDWAVDLIQQPATRNVLAASLLSAAAGLLYLRLGQQSGDHGSTGEAEDDGSSTPSGKSKVEIVARSTRSKSVARRRKSAVSGEAPLAIKRRGPPPRAVASSEPLTSPAATKASPRMRKSAAAAVALSAPAPVATAGQGAGASKLEAAETKTDKSASRPSTKPRKSPIAKSGAGARRPGRPRKDAQATGPNSSEAALPPISVAADQPPVDGTANEQGAQSIPAVAADSALGSAKPSSARGHNPGRPPASDSRRKLSIAVPRSPDLDAPTPAASEPEPVSADG